MPKGTNQKLKLYYLSRIMTEKTDDEHHITMPEIQRALEGYGVTADRKSLYDDLEALRVLGIDVIGEKNGRSYSYHVGKKQFEIAELKLLVDAIQSSKFITEKKSNDGDEGDIILSLETAGNNHGIVDIVDGHIIDQCISGNKWFYVTGCTEELQRIFEDLHVIKTGRITVYQYIELVKCIYKAGNDVIDNQVSLSALDKPIDSKTSLPKGLAAKLYRYQETGYRWMLYMLEENRGCILGDEMGLGKTLQVIAVMLEMKKENKTPMLVVAPVSLLQNWKRECEKFAPDLRVVIHHGSFRTGRYKELEEYDVVVTAYSTVVSDASLFSMINWKIVVLDTGLIILTIQS